MRNLRLPGALIGLGYGGILFWTLAYLVAVLPTREASTWVYWLTTTAGYGLAGFACWRWITRSWKSENGRELVRGPSRWMAAASLITGAGVATLTYQLYQDHPALGFDNVDFHYGLRLAGFVAGTLGFLVAAAGFWIASNARPAEPGANQEQPLVLDAGPLSGPIPASSDGVKL